MKQDTSETIMVWPGCSESCSFANVLASITGKVPPPNTPHVSHVTSASLFMTYSSGILLRLAGLYSIGMANYNIDFAICSNNELPYS